MSMLRILREAIQSLAQRLWPLHQGGGTAVYQRDTYLKPLVVLLLVFIAGPDLLPAIELTTLLELLGASLFLLAFATGYRMLVAGCFSWLRSVFIPGNWATLLCLPTTSLRAFAFLVISWNALMIFLCFCYLPYLSLLELLRAVA